MAKCCNPIPGDEILGFVTRTRGVTVHKADCPNLRNEDEQERIVHVSWGAIRELYPVRLRIEAYDRVGLLRDATVQVSEEKVNIASVVTEENPDGTVTMELTLHTTGLDQLGKLFSKLESVRGITSVTRVRSGVAAAAKS
jgi:GTP pyrophosphokinase